jgi:outer membrane lipoprotein carrier protein
MKHTSLFLALLIVSAHAFTQESNVIQDPAAGKVLERVSTKFKTLKSLGSDFDMVIEDRKENTKSSSTGSLLMKQNKYKLTSEGNTVYFNGTTMWTYVSATNEVTITEPQQNTDDFMSNPSLFFNQYKRDFKYRYLRSTTKNGVTCHEIDLFPKNLHQPYSRVKVFINAATDLPVAITSVGKDGVDYTVVLKNTIIDKDIPDTAFTFNPAQFKKVEVIDMRGVK